jgi:ubiquinol-cytochrome c reductase cytochrome c1 subunit|tara:strand:- start:9 stop:773 length:765 start_codon:yes stop_codon:yes gene_type:complete
MYKFSLVFVFLFTSLVFAAGEMKAPMEPDWTFQGPLGKFDRAELQRGYQVYTEVCSSCHSMNLLSYRNLVQAGGPEFSEEQAKAMAAMFEVETGPNSDGEMFMRPAILSDRFVSPWKNEQEGRVANGGAYPPDLSVMVKARSGGADYVYSLILGYKDEVPEGVTLDDGVYYNVYAKNQKIAMPQVLYEDGVEYTDGTAATEVQMAKDVTAFLAWSAEPKLEERKRIGFKVIIYLIILSFLLYFTNKRIWKDTSH